MLRLYVDAFMCNNETNNEPRRLRGNNYIVKDYADILKYRALEMMPIDHEIMLELKKNGHARKDFGRTLWYTFRIEKLDTPTNVHLKRRGIIK